METRSPISESRVAHWPGAGGNQTGTNGASKAERTAAQAPTVLAADEERGRFAGKVAIITGSSDKGIGGAIARRLTQEGAAVSLSSRREPKQLLRRLAKQHPGNFVHTQANLLDPSSVSRIIDRTMEEFGQIDLLINNAGVDECRSLDQLSDEEWHRILNVNLTGTMRLSRAVLPYLTEPGGVIVNVSSALALGGCAGFAAYSASKAGLIGFTQALAAELAPKRQRVVGVAPAVVFTPMMTRYVGELYEQVWKRVEDCHPLGVGLPDDVANAVAFLASEEARWISGTTLPLGWMPTFPLPADLFQAGG